MDKLDKAIDELLNWNKETLNDILNKEVVVVEKPIFTEKIVYGQCSKCGGSLTSDHKCPIKNISSDSPFGEWE